jgi:putative FmdB family regulatory protein
MPKYDYECSGCEHQLVDVQQSFHDDALTTCRRSKRKEVQK